MAFVRDPSTGVEISAYMDLYILLKEHKLAGKSEKRGIHVRNRSIASDMKEDLNDVFEAMGIGPELYPARMRFTTYVDRMQLMLGI